MSDNNDPRLTYLNAAGYNVVRYPSSKLQPMAVIGREGKDKRILGTVNRLWNTDAALPAAETLDENPDLAGSLNCSVDTSFGLNFLAKAFAIFGASAPSLDASYKNARSGDFKLSGVKVKTIDPFDVGDYFTRGTFETSNPVVNVYIDNEDCEMLLVTDVLEAHHRRDRAGNSGAGRCEVLL